MKRLLRALGIVLCLVIASHAFGQSTCSYNTYQWNTKEKRAVNYQKVVHPYSQLSDEERDPITGCTVCIEDQVKISIPPVKPFYVCKVIAPEIQNILEGLIRSGESIVDVTGYRVGKTRGGVDKQGNRTKFSNHAYGVAIDINPEQNGLYDKCIEFGVGCRLIRGGRWEPGKRCESIEPDGFIVRAFKELGYLWGGEIQGRQKDFMHFSLTGY
ncbi:MAG: hypothetical protein COB41_05455 [Proteobacteria bacterium]|nr:MAG: hypothetical protein COB41_05455 [Pseudomonadota bacterium]